jgi:DNA invertase Pin-like site-specific DNA recombinase
LANRTVEVNESSGRQVFAAIYARKSTEQAGVADEQKSVARQVENARAFAAARGWTVGPVFADDAVSGAEISRLKDRQRLLEAIRAGRPIPGSRHA